MATGGQTSFWGGVQKTPLWPHGPGCGPRTTSTLAAREAVSNIITVGKEEGEVSWGSQLGWSASPGTTSSARVQNAESRWQGLEGEHQGPEGGQANYRDAVPRAPHRAEGLLPLGVGSSANTASAVRLLGTSWLKRVPPPAQDRCPPLPWPFVALQDQWAPVKLVRFAETPWQPSSSLFPILLPDLPSPPGSSTPDKHPAGCQWHSLHQEQGPSFFL